MTNYFICHSPLLNLFENAKKLGQSHNSKQTKMGMAELVKWSHKTGFPFQVLRIQFIKEISTFLPNLKKITIL